MDHFDLSDLPVEQIKPVEKPTPAKLATRVVSNIAAGAVSATLVSLIHQNTATYNRRQTVQLYIGAYVIGAMAADKAREHVTAKVAPTMQAIEDWLWIPVEPELPTTVENEGPIQEDPTEQ